MAVTTALTHTPAPPDPLTSDNRAEVVQRCRRRSCWNPASWRWWVSLWSRRMSRTFTPGQRMSQGCGVCQPWQLWWLWTASRIGRLEKPVIFFCNARFAATNCKYITEYHIDMIKVSLFLKKSCTKWTALGLSRLTILIHETVHCSTHLTNSSLLRNHLQYSCKIFLTQFFCILLHPFPIIQLLYNLNYHGQIYISYTHTSPFLM